MSGFTRRWIKCDEPGCTTQFEGSAGENYRSHSMSETVASIRARAWVRGWKRRQNQDFCPPHAGGRG